MWGGGGGGGAALEATPALVRRHPAPQSSADRPSSTEIKTLPLSLSSGNASPTCKDADAQHSRSRTSNFTDVNTSCFITPWEFVQSRTEFILLAPI